MMATIFNPLIPPSKNPRINAASWSAGPFFLLISSVFLVSIQRCLQLQLLSELQRYINEGNNISVYTCHVKQSRDVIWRILHEFGENEKVLCNFASYLHSMDEKTI